MQERQLRVESAR